MKVYSSFLSNVFVIHTNHSVVKLLCIALFELELCNSFFDIQCLKIDQKDYLNILLHNNLVIADNILQ